MAKVLNVQFIVDMGDDNKDSQVIDMLTKQMKLQNHMLPPQVKVLFGEEIK